MSAQRWVQLDGIGVMAALILTALAVRLYMSRHAYPENDLYVGTFTRMDSIVSGALGALLLEMFQGSSVRKPSRQELNLALWPCFAVLLFLVLRAAKSAAMLEWGFTAVALLCTTVVVLSTFLVPDSTLYKILTISSLLYLGRRSYGIYIYHGLILDASEHFRIKHSPANYALITMMRLILIFGLVELSFRYIETPFLKLKNRFEVAAPTPLQHA